jgi:hypothetical protein
MTPADAEHAWDRSQLAVLEDLWSLTTNRDSGAWRGWRRLLLTARTMSMSMAYWQLTVPRFGSADQVEAARAFVPYCCGCAGSYRRADIEFLLAAMDQVFNEMAPRVHNSGH